MEDYKREREREKSHNAISMYLSNILCIFEARDVVRNDYVCSIDALNVILENFGRGVTGGPEERERENFLSHVHA